MHLGGIGRRHLAPGGVILTLAVAILALGAATPAATISRIGHDRAANLHPLVEEAPVAAPCPTPRAEGTESGMLPGTCLLLRCRVVVKTVPCLLERGETAAEIDHGAQ